MRQTVSYRSEEGSPSAASTIPARLSSLYLDSGKDRDDDMHCDSTTSNSIPPTANAMTKSELSTGYVPLPSSVYEAFARTQFSGHERRVLDVIIRKTLGWNKLSDVVSMSQFVNATGLTKSEVCHAVDKLKKRNVIGRVVVKIHNAPLARYSFNQEFGEWHSLEKTTTLEKSTKKPLEKSTHTISTLKETTTTSLGSKSQTKEQKPQTQTLEDKTWAGISSGSYDPHKDRYHQPTFNPDDDKEEER
jgi:phage replication O-like protein O